MTLPTITLYNTLTKKKEALEPLEPGKVGLYVCGVTVYDLSHIGHGRTFVTFDTVVRYLRHRGYQVRFVRNHTDVDDKIIARANERGVAPIALAQQYIDALDQDMAALGCIRPDVEPRVTEYIAQIIAMVERLIERGHAYAVEGDVFYDVSSFPDYGKLSGQRLEEMRAGERITVDERKKSPFDFALWKSAKPGEPAWPSPWGDGRPGWHIECSAMSTENLGPHFDIHGGGGDLVFPHHENEIAQSEGATGCKYANYWMHGALLNVEGEKMSKSLGNFWTIRDVLAHYEADTIRFFLLSAHYRKPVNYSHLNLELARHRVLYLYRTRLALAELWQTLERPAADAALAAELLEAFHAAMDDDFNSPLGLSVIGDAARRANELLGTKKLARKPEVLAQIAALDQVLGLCPEVYGILAGDPVAMLAEIRTRQARQLDIDEAWVTEQIAQRIAARAAKDWAAADAIRDALAERHVELMDRPDGTDWRIVSPEIEEG